MTSTSRMVAVENRLAKAVDVPRGEGGRALLIETDKRMASIRPNLENYVQARMDKLMRYAAAPDDVLFAECRDLGRAALEIAEVAGAAKMVTAGEIARGISAMVNCLFTSGAWHGDGVRVHLHALALTTAKDPAAVRGAPLMLDRLRVMRAVLGIFE